MGVLFFNHSNPWIRRKLLSFTIGGAAQQGTARVVAVRRRNCFGLKSPHPGPLPAQAGREFTEMKSRAVNPRTRASPVAQTFLSAGGGDFPVASPGRSASNTGQECPANPQTGMSALRGSGRRI